VKTALTATLSTQIMNTTNQSLPYWEMATATVPVGVAEENIMDINSSTKDSCCIKCFDLEVKL
jgi:hypothetical protein